MDPIFQVVTVLKWPLSACGLCRWALFSGGLYLVTITMWPLQVVFVYMCSPFAGGVMDELDVIVVGGNFGGGHRSNLMSHFLCAVAVPPSSGEKPTEFQTFCRVISDTLCLSIFYAFLQFNEINPQLKSIPFTRNLANSTTTPFTAECRPSCLIYAGTARFGSY